MRIEHKGQQLDVDPEWDGISNGLDEPPGIDGLRFVVIGIDDREPTPEEAERLDQELCDRYDSDPKFADRVGAYVWDSFDSHD